MNGIESVVSALGKLDAIERVTAIENIVAGMQLHGVRRIVAVGGIGCLQLTESTRYQESPTFPRFFLKTSLAHWEVCRRLESSGLDWTFVCPPDIRDGSATGKYATVPTFLPPASSISTGDLAHCMMDAVENRRLAAPLRARLQARDQQRSHSVFKERCFAILAFRKFAGEGAPRACIVKRRGAT